MLSIDWVCNPGLISVTSGAGDIAERVLREASPHLLKAAKLGSESKARTAVCLQNVFYLVIYILQH